MLLGRLTVIRKVKLPEDSAFMGICSGSPSVLPNRMADAPPALAAGLHSAVNVTGGPRGGGGDRRPPAAQATRPASSSSPGSPSGISSRRAGDDDREHEQGSEHGKPEQAHVRFLPEEARARRRPTAPPRQPPNASSLSPR